MTPRRQAALSECIRVFGPDKVVIFSNSAGEAVVCLRTPARSSFLLPGSSDDADFQDAQRITHSMGVHVLQHGTKV